MSREIYAGCGLSPIDAKGRVAIPAQLRKKLVLNNGGGSDIGLTLSRNETCLSCFDVPYVNGLRDALEQEYLERKPNEPNLTRDYLRREAGAIEFQPFDASGRFVLSSSIRGLIELEDLAFFFGAMDIMEIWRPDVALASDLIPAVTKRMLEIQLKERGGK